MEVRPPKVPASDGSGESRRDRQFHLKVIEPENYRGQIYDLSDEITVGRAVGCGVHVEDAYTSNLHARVYRRDAVSGWRTSAHRRHLGERREDQRSHPTGPRGSAPGGRHRVRDGPMTAP